MQKKKTEEEIIKSKFFDGNTIIQANSTVKEKKFLHILCGLKQYGNENDGPDLISQEKNIIYGIEYFEFDSAKNDRKGSKYRQQIANIDNSINTKIKNNDFIKNTSVLTLDSSLENYINNYKCVYNYHYSRVSEYIKRLNSDFPKLEKEIWFFIDDITPFGNHYIDNDGNPILFFPMLSKEIVRIFENSKLIKGIMFATNTASDRKIIRVYSNNDRKINILKKECEKENVTSLMSQNPLCITMVRKIKKIIFNI